MRGLIALQGFDVEHLFHDLNLEMLPDSCPFKRDVEVYLDVVRALGIKLFGADYLRERLTAISVHALSQAVPQSTDSATEHSNAYGCATL